MEQLIPHSDARESQPSRKNTLGAKGVSLRRALPRQTVTPSIVGTVLLFSPFNNSFHSRCAEAGWPGCA